MHYWDFDTLPLSREDQILLLKTLALYLDLKLDPWTLERFLLLVEKSYQPLPYHCFAHAALVTQAGYLLLEAAKRQGHSFDMTEKTTFFFALICHDCGHDGLENLVHDLLKTSTFKKYPTSTLERNSIELGLSLLTTTGLISAIDQDLFIRLILSTDLKYSPPRETPPKTELLVQMIQIADLSNFIRPHFESLWAWSGRIQEERFKIGEILAEKGWEPPFTYDRSNPHQAKADLGLTDKILQPRLSKLLEDLPVLKDRWPVYLKNWEQLIKLEEEEEEKANKK